MDFGFSSLHPLPCFVYYIGVIILSMTLYHPIFLFTSFILILVLNFLQDKGKSLKSYYKFYIFISLLIVIINPLICHRGRTILFYFLDNPITLEAIVYGITMMLSLLTILVTFLSYNQTITSDKFMYLFSSILPQSTFLTMMTMRFVPMLRRRSNEISTVQKTRGVSTSLGSFKDRVKNGMQILNILVMWSLEESIRTAQSMRARGYGTKKKRTFYFTYKMDKRDFIVLVLVILLIISLLVFWYSQYFSFQIYPEIDSMCLNLNSLVVYVLFVFYMSIPIIIEGADRLKWH